MKPLAALLAVIGVVTAGLGLRTTATKLDAGEASTVNADRPGINAHNSPAVAVRHDRPEILVVADRIDTPRFSCSLHVSSNRGETWRPLPVPLARDAPNCYWPDVAFDGEGRLLVLYTATGGRYNQPLGVWLQRYDGDEAVGPPTRIAGSEAFHAHFAVEGNRVVVVWVQAKPENADRPLGFEPPPNPVMLARSDDGGLTFSPPVRVSEPDRRVAQPSVLLLPDGALVVGALDLGDDAFNYEARHEGQGGPPPDGRWRVVTWRSTDGGATFSGATTVAGDLVIPERVIIDLMPGPSFARDPSAAGLTLYAAWDAGQGDTRDVFLARSGDGGTTWSPPTRLTPTAGSQHLPAVSVAPDGRVDVVFYDRSGDARDRAAEVRVGSSWDGGRTFTTTVASAQPFDSGVGLASAQGLAQLGNQLALASYDDTFVAFWADTSGGTEATNLQDLGVASVDARESGRRSTTLVAVGVALILAAAPLLALATRRSRRNRRLPPPRQTAAG